MRAHPDLPIARPSGSRGDRATARSARVDRTTARIDPHPARAPARTARPAFGRRGSRIPGGPVLRKTIGLLLAVLAIWITVEIYTQGADNAFGGRFAALIGNRDAPQAPRGSTVQRVGSAVGRAHREHDERYDKLMPE